jgi:hypothetical protein
MPRVLRSLTGRALGAGMLGLTLAANAAAQPPADPIATSNRLTERWNAPGIKQVSEEVPWLPLPNDPKPMPSAPRGKALLERITTPVPATAVTPPPPASTSPPITWSIPSHRPITSIMPTSDRPMMPCEMAVTPPVSVPAPMPPRCPQPPPRPLTPGEGEPQSSIPSPPAPPPSVAPTMTSTDDDPPAKMATTVRFIDEPALKPPVDDTILMAVIRRGGAPTGSAADIRTAVERVCRNKVVECQTEVAGERQVRVALTVHTADDWQRLYDRMQSLSELGEYGLLFEVKVEK